MLRTAAGHRLGVRVMLLVACALAACAKSHSIALVGMDGGPDAAVSIDAGLDSECRDAGAADGGAPLILGTYVNCESRVVAGGSTAGGPGGEITLSEGEGSLRLAIARGLFALGEGTIDFRALNASAAVATPSQTYAISNVPCATSTIRAGALTRDGDALAVSLLGEGCGTEVSGTLRCQVPASSTRMPAAPLPDCKVPAFAVGSYEACTPSVAGYGGGGVILTQSGDTIAAALQGLSDVAAGTTLSFHADTSASATIHPGQSWVISVPGVSAPFVSTTVQIHAGMLVVDGSTLFAFVSGSDVAGVHHQVFHCARSR